MTLVETVLKFLSNIKQFTFLAGHLHTCIGDRGSTLPLTSSIRTIMQAIYINYTNIPTYLHSEMWVKFTATRTEDNRTAVECM